MENTKSKLTQKYMKINRESKRERERNKERQRQRQRERERKENREYTSVLWPSGIN